MMRTQILAVRFSFIVALLGGLSLNLMAQEKADTAKNLRFGLSAEAGRPIRNFDENYKTGFGGNAIISYAVRKEVKLTLSAGYMHFAGNYSEDEYFIYDVPDWGAIPVRFGGMYFATRHVFIKAETGGVFFVEPGRGTSLILSPGIGLELHNFVLAGKLETWTDGGLVSYVGLNLGYFF